MSAASAVPQTQQHARAPLPPPAPGADDVPHRVVKAVARAPDLLEQRRLALVPKRRVAAQQDEQHDACAPHVHLRARAQQMAQTQRALLAARARMLAAPRCMRLPMMSACAGARPAGLAAKVQQPQGPPPTDARKLYLQPTAESTRRAAPRAPLARTRRRAWRRRPRAPRTAACRTPCSSRRPTASRGQSRRS